MNAKLTGKNAENFFFVLKSGGDSRGFGTWPGLEFGHIGRLDT